MWMLKRAFLIPKTVKRVVKTVILVLREWLYCANFAALTNCDTKENTI